MWLALLTATALLANAPTELPSDPTGAWGGRPVVTNDGQQVTISGTIPGSDSESDSYDTEDTGPRAPRAPLGPGAHCIPTDPLCRVAYSVEQIQQPTLTDLATFAPAAPVLISEPAGVAIAGLPANFVTTATEHTATGELFSRPVTVRFTPVSFTFDHGDGTTATTRTAGRTWADLGQPQFTPTATSHAYARRGTYIAATTVTYTAAVNFGTGWVDVPGTLPLTSAGNGIQVYEARTALVARTCLENPAGPGC